MTLFAMQRSLFRAYDIRGDRHCFSADFMTALANAFAERYKNHHAHNQNNQHKNATIVIGFDVRHGSDTIAHCLMDTLQHHGLTIVNLGLITTPMMAFWAQRYDGHGIMVTASHSAKDILGIKWLVANTSPSHDDIEALYNALTSPHSTSPLQHHPVIFASSNAQPLASPIIELPTATITSTYITAIRQVFDSIYNTKPPSLPPHSAKLNLTVVIDCMHGATSSIAAPLFNAFAAHVILLNDSPNGDFPTGNPDPTEPKRLAELQRMVSAHHADMGLAFDGDGDRLMVVDDKGTVINPDHLLYLLAQVALTERPKSKMAVSALKPPVLFDIKCSHHLPPLLATLGATPIMSQTGSSLLRRQLQTDHCLALFAGELSGHFIFNDGYFMAYDDAMYAGLRLLHWLVHTAPNPLITTADAHKNGHKNEQSQGDTIKLSAITKTLPTLISTADHYLPLPPTLSQDCNITEHLTTLCRCLRPLVTKSDCPAATDDPNVTPQIKSSCRCFAHWHSSHAQIQHLLPVGTQLSCIDGVRLDFAKGFGVLRKSNTSHSLTVRFAGDSMADLKAVQSRFVTLCRTFDSHLAQQIEAIGTEIPLLSPVLTTTI